jgi:hypothetical protein
LVLADCSLELVPLELFSSRVMAPTAIFESAWATFFIHDADLCAFSSCAGKKRGVAGQGACARPTTATVRVNGRRGEWGRRLA